MQLLSRIRARRHLFQEVLIFFAFLCLTLAMTWPWIKHLRDFVSDSGDPYLNSWILWWDYHQTFHDPVNLFHANIFYPYQYTLAFSENNYGIALLFFPLFALGFRPLTVHSIATLVGFALSGYGAFRLARTLTASGGAAWVTGIAFAFIPYRFGQLPHLNYLFAGWIPLLLESLVLFARERSWRRAAWLGTAFLMNALTCIHWFVLTLVPLALSGGFLVARYRLLLRERKFWLRAGAALCVACLLLAPFLWPYMRAAKLYGFVRSFQEALAFSAHPVDWLVADGRNKIWGGFNASIGEGEKSLFPGLLILLLALGSLLFAKKATPGKVDNEVDNNDAQRAPERPRSVLVGLDLLALAAGTVALLSAGPDPFRLHIFGVNLLTSHSTHRALAVCFIAVLVRWCLAYPEVLRRHARRNLIATLQSEQRTETFWLGVIWTITGFFGSLGMNFFFHRVLYDFIEIFRSIRVPARWSMICYLGLALLAGLGAQRLTELIARQEKRVWRTMIFAFIALALLFEQRAAPLVLVRGAVDPTPLALHLKETPMAGGIVELPVESSDDRYRYVLRAADHARPLVTAVSGFDPPIYREIETLTKMRPVPERFLDLLESISCSYMVIHNGSLSPESRLALESVIGKGLATGRLRFIRSFGESDLRRDDLYAVLKTEPQAQSEAALPALIPQTVVDLMQEDRALIDPMKSSNPIDDPEFFTRAHYKDFLKREPDARALAYWTKKIAGCGQNLRCIDEERVNVSAAFFFEPEFQETGYFIYRLYRDSLARPPTYVEWTRDRDEIQIEANLASSKTAFVKSFVARPEFTQKYPAQMRPEQFVDALLAAVKEASGVGFTPAQRNDFVASLINGAGRDMILRRAIDDATVVDAERNDALVLMQYFGYLRRDPDRAAFDYWIDLLNNKQLNNFRVMVRAFIRSKEYRSRFSN